MNLRITGILAATLLLTMGTVAQAQGPGHKGKPWKKESKQGRNPGDRESDRMMREASQRIEQAQRLMRQALPIYNGHRAEALERSQRALWEIKTGLAWDRMHEQGGKMGNPSFGKVNDGRRGSRITNEQVRRSNERLVHASRLLQEAQGYLERAQPDYGGYRRRAIDSTRDAIQHLREALRSV